MLNLKYGVSFVLSGLVNAVRDQVQTEMGFVAAQYDFLMAVSRINRLTYQGPYQRFKSEL